MQYTMDMSKALCGCLQWWEIQLGSTNCNQGPGELPQQAFFRVQRPDRDRR